jgi:hypothetical protein
VLVATSDENVAKNIATRIVNLEYGVITKEFENK